MNLSDSRKGFIAAININKVFIINIVALFLTLGIGYDNVVIFGAISIILLSISIISFIKIFIINKFPLDKKLLVILIFFALYFSISEILTFIHFGISGKLLFYFYWCVFSLDSAIWGYYLAKNFQNENFLNTFLISLLAIVYVCFLGISFNWIRSLLLGSTLRNPNISSQKVGYYLSFAYSIFLYFFLFNKEVSNFKIIKILQNKTLLSLIISILPILVSSYGGRGAFVNILALLIVAFIIKLIFSLKEHKMKGFFQFILLIFISCFITIFMFNNVTYVNNGLHRIIPFSLITKVCNNDNYNDSKNDSKNDKPPIIVKDIDIVTAGRGSLYLNAIETIKKKPILGYGSIEYMHHWSSTYNYPHNLFFEWMLQGGIIYTIFMLFLSLLAIGNIVKNSYKEKKLLMFLLIGIYPAINLMFSNTYLNNSYFWFILFFGIFFEKNRISLKKEVNT